LAQPPSEIRAPNSRYGIVSFDLNGPVPDRLRALGVGLVRGSCPWASLEPARGIFDWGCADNVIVGAQRFGWRSYLTITCTPNWANHDAGCFEMPADVSDWYELVSRFVARYASYNAVLGVWNEPNLALHENAAGTNYALLFTNASNARNVVAPSFVLAGPEVSHHALADGYLLRTMDFIRAARALDPQDVFSVHWYSDGPPLPAFMDAADSMAGTQEVWLSETGFVSKDAAAQADFFTKVLTEFSSGERPWWTHVIFYRLWDGQDCCSEAILKADYSVKPAFDRYRDWIANHSLQHGTVLPVMAR
jgi:hypothetical protein